MIRLSMVIVTLNRRDEVSALLTDLGGQVQPESDDEISLVHHGPPDGTAVAVRTPFPPVLVIRHFVNGGAPAGRNAGACAAVGDVLVFLDDDARVDDPEFVARVRHVFENEGEAGVVAFRILDPATRKARGFEIPCRDKKRVGDSFETSYFIAAGCAVRSAVYADTGGMDESLIYGFEELDFGYRAVARGHRIFYRPEVCILHGLSSTGRPGWRALYYFLRNKIWVSARYLPWSMVLSQIVVWSAFFLRESLRIGRPDVFARALLAGLAGIPRRRALRHRDRLSRETLDRLRRLEGRLYT